MSADKPMYSEQDLLYITFNFEESEKKLRTENERLHHMLLQAISIGGLHFHHGKLRANERQGYLYDTAAYPELTAFVEELLEPEEVE